MAKNFYYLVFFLLLAFNSFGQINAEYKILKKKYPTEGAVYLKNFQELNIDIVDKALKISTHSIQERMLLDNRAGLFSEYSIDYNDFSKITDIQASTFLPVKSNYKVLKVKDFKTTEGLSKNVFYDGSKNISFLFPSLIEGARTNLHFLQDISHPQIIPAFYFDQHIPVIQSIYSIVTDPDVELGWKIFNVPDSVITFTKIAKKNKVVYTWQVNNLKAYRNEENAPNYLYSLGHMVAWVKSYNIDGKNYPLLKTSKDLYNWYYTISKNSNKEHSPELKTLVDSLTQDCKDEAEKVKKIYYWVQDHIKYIAIEDGMGGFVPRSAKTVFDRRYGDCKDMASIITKMLTYADIPSHLTWIGSRHIPYRYEDIPTPHVDNHMIATYVKDSSYYFLDATASFLPFGFSNGFIQGKQAMIGMDSTHLEIKEVPVIPMDQNQVLDSVFIEIKDNKILGKASAYYSGYNKIYLTERLRDHRYEKEKLLKAVLTKGNNKFLLDSFDLIHLNDRDKALRIDYKFNVEDYFKSSTDEIYVNLNLNKDFFIEEIKNNRNFDVEKDFKEIKTSIIKLKIPEGYKVSFLPSPAKFLDERFGFETNHRQENGHLILEQKIYYNFLIMKKKEFEQWNSFIRTLRKTYSELIVLEKIK
ncbi:MAG TPA: DUF3857 domain-containing protein [Cytophagales bacterium]|nr:DUF3857 domain-containing protein [Cytophagales bacterium]